MSTEYVIDVATGQESYVPKSAEQLQAEANARAEQEANQYKENRIYGTFEKNEDGTYTQLTSNYPSIQEQLDMQYHDAVNGTTTWKDAIAQVKADNPKPE